MTTAVGSGETRASWLARAPMIRLVRVLAALVLVALMLIAPPLGPQPAAAAPPALGVSLTQSSADSAIGSDLTLTATVTWSGGESPEPPGGWYVEFTGTADGGWSSGPIQTDDDEATYTRTSPIAQTETITARVVSPDCSETSNEVTHEWWRSEIEITDPNANTDLESELSFAQTGYTLSGRVLRNGQPVEDAQVSITTISYGADFDPDVGPTRTLLPVVRTGSDGGFSASWSSSVTAHERVEIDATTDDGFSAETVTSHTWSGAEEGIDEITLEAASEKRTGERVLAEAKLLVDGDPVTAPSVDFGIRAGWVSVRGAPTSTTASILYEVVSEPFLVVPAVRSSRDGLYLGSTTRFWQPVITFVTPQSTSRGGQEYPATVIVTDLGVPQANVKLNFTEGTGPAARDYATATTGPDGRASAPIARASGNSVALRVTEVPDPDTDPTDGATIAAHAETTHAWVTPAPDVRVTLAPPDDNGETDDRDESFESRVGTRVPFTARVTSGDDPLRNWDVEFAIDGEPAETESTGADGEAVMRTVHSTESFDEISATVSIAGCGERSVEVDHYWWETGLELTPKATTSPARRDVTFSAGVGRTVFEDVSVESAESERVAAAAVPAGLAPLDGQLVRFTMSSERCDLPVVVREDTTDENGIATVTLSRDGPTVDSVRAEEVGVFDPASDTTTHTWGTPAPVPMSITLVQSTPESRAGTDVTYVATVHDTAGPDGHAPAGVPVTFLGVSPSRTAFTDGDGVARTTVAGTGTTATTITASAPFGCGVVLSEPVTHRWFVPTLELTPVTATSTTGETATATARLRHGSDGINGQVIKLTIDSSAPGELTKIYTEVTRNGGIAEFPWTRTNPGTDDLTAIEMIDVLPQQDSVTRVWEAPPVTPRPDTPMPIDAEPVPPPEVITEPSITDEPSIDEPTEPEKPITPPPPPPTPEPPSDLPATSKLVDGPEVGRPGADIEVSGNGCQAGQQLTVSLGETELGETRAAADGTFYLRAVVPDLPLGRYVIHSTCGKTIGDPNVDITSPQVDKARAAIAAVGVTTASTFVFFLLIAKGVISFLPQRPM